MKTRIALLLLVLFGAVAFIFVTVKGEADDFIFERMDYRTDLSVTASTGLNTLIGQTDPRFVVLYANQLKDVSIGPMPSELLNLLAQVSDRPIILYANATLNYPISPVPDALLALLRQVSDRPLILYANETINYPISPPPDTLVALVGQVSDRPIILYANQKVDLPLAYPSGLVHDTTQPGLLSMNAALEGKDRVRLITSTSELSNVRLKYGSSPGSYPYEIVKYDYSTQQEWHLTDIVQNQTYYFRYQMTDRAGNTADSEEYQFTIQSAYLPLIKR